jgi:hypothetical protein
MKIVFTDYAKDNIKQAKLFYKQQNKHLGEYFLSVLKNDINSLKDCFATHKQVNGFYKLLTQIFPFAVYYKVNKNNIIIYAVLDCRAKPIQKFTNL